MDFILGTGIVWLLGALVVNPIAKTLTEGNRKVIIPPSGQTTADAKPASEVDTGYYILTDVIVLGIAGFLIGLISGWFFIGVSFRAKGWPGMIAFIAASFFGSAIHG